MAEINGAICAGKSSVCTACCGDNVGYSRCSKYPKSNSKMRSTMTSGDQLSVWVVGWDGAVVMN